MATRKLWMARITTRHFTFDAVATTRPKVEAALRAGWKVHCRQYTSAAHGYINELIEDAEVAEIEIGACYRDGEKIA